MASLTFKFIVLLLTAIFASVTMASRFCSFKDACTKARIDGIKYGILIDQCKKVYKIRGDCKLKYIGKIYWTDDEIFAGLAS